MDHNDFLLKVELPWVQDPRCVARTPYLFAPYRTNSLVPCRVRVCALALFALAPDLRV